MLTLILNCKSMPPKSGLNDLTKITLTADSMQYKVTRLICFHSTYIFHWIQHLQTVTHKHLLPHSKTTCQCSEEMWSLHQNICCRCTSKVNSKWQVKTRHSWQFEMTVVCTLNPNTYSTVTSNKHYLFGFENDDLKQWLTHLALTVDQETDRPWQFKVQS